MEDVFGLCYLLGFSFMPRIRDLADQQLYRINRDAAYPNLGGIFRGGMDVSLICEQWDQLVRVAASQKPGLLRTCHYPAIGPSVAW